jgi:hypothetical protein
MRPRGLPHRAKQFLALSEGRNMFTSIRKYTMRRGSAKELARRVQDDFVPLVRQMQGFRGYYLLDGGLDVLIRISMFDSANEAFLSNEKAANWVRNNVLEFTKGKPEVMVGNALVAEDKQRRPSCPDTGLPQPMPDAVTLSDQFCQFSCP